MLKEGGEGVPVGHGLERLAFIVSRYRVSLLSCMFACSLFDVLFTCFDDDILLLNDGVTSGGKRGHVDDSEADEIEPAHEGRTSNEEQLGLCTIRGLNRKYKCISSSGRFRHAPVASEVGPAGSRSGVSLRPNATRSIARFETKSQVRNAVYLTELKARMTSARSRSSQEVYRYTTGNNLP